MTVDVFHHHDGVVHEDADGKDQSEEGDPVQGVPEEHAKKEGHGQGDRHSHGDDHGLVEAEKEGDEHGHRNGGQEEMLDEFVGFLFGGSPIISGDGHLDVGRYHPPLEAPHQILNGLGNGHGIAPLLLRHVEGNSDIPFSHLFRVDPFFFSAGPDAEEDVVLRLRGPVHNAGHIPQIDGGPVPRAHHHILQIVGGSEVVANLHPHRLVLLIKMPGLEVPVHACKALGHPECRKPAGGQPVTGQEHLELPRLSPQDLHLRHIPELLNLRPQFPGDPAQGVPVILLSP